MKLADAFLELAVGFSVYDQADNGNYHCDCARTVREEQQKCPNCKKVIRARNALEAGVSLCAGPTGQYPDDVIAPDDEGELRIVLLTDREHHTVVLNFGKTVTWLGMPPAQARALAESLINQAHQLEGEETNGRGSTPDRPGGNISPL